MFFSKGQMYLMYLSASVRDSRWNNFNCRVCTGHGIPGKLWNFSSEKSRAGYVMKILIIFCEKIRISCNFWII